MYTARGSSVDICLATPFFAPLIAVAPSYHLPWQCSIFRFILSGVSLMTDTNKSAVIELVIYKPMNSSCTSSYSLTQQSTRTTCSLFDWYVVLLIITVKYTAFWILLTIFLRMCSAIMERNLFWTSGEVYFSCCLSRNLLIGEKSSPHKTSSWCGGWHLPHLHLLSKQALGEREIVHLTAISANTHDLPSFQQQLVEITYLQHQQ